MQTLTRLPLAFRRVELALAREPGHPEGDAARRLTLVAPLNADGELDPVLWHAHRDSCRVVRHRGDGSSEVGRLIRQPGGSWVLRYQDGAREDDDPAYRFNDAVFVPGAYVSVKENDGPHTFRVVSVSKI